MDRMQKYGGLAVLVLLMAGIVMWSGARADEQSEAAEMISKASEDRSTLQYERGIAWADYEVYYDDFDSLNTRFIAGWQYILNVSPTDHELIASALDTLEDELWDIEQALGYAYLQWTYGNDYLDTAMNLWYPQAYYTYAYNDAYRSTTDYYSPEIAVVQDVYTYMCSQAFSVQFAAIDLLLVSYGY